MRTLHTLGLCAVLGLAGTAMSAMAPAPAAQVASSAFAIAQVVHSATGEPLAGMPVVVQQVINPEMASPRVYMTGSDGSAVIGPLESGTYIAYVSYNNNQSAPYQFEINGDTDNIVVFTLYFNPDIDPSK